MAFRRNPDLLAAIVIIVWVRIVAEELRNDSENVLLAKQQSCINVVVTPGPDEGQEGIRLLPRRVELLELGGFRSGRLIESDADTDCAAVF